MRRVWRFLGWLVLVEGLITIFGVITAPLLLSLAADCALGVLLLRSYREFRASPVVDRYEHSGG